MRFELLVICRYRIVVKYMSNKKRKISARIILFVYLTSLVSVTLFHYHGNDSVDNGYHAATIVSFSHQSTSDKHNDLDPDQCSLCLITSAQFDAFSNTFPVRNDAENQLLVVASSDLSIPFVNYSSTRAPPVII